MGDMGEVFNAMKEAGRARREANRKAGPALLESRGIAFESKNDGAHLIVRHSGLVADYWPGTGFWRVRGGRKGRGVFSLIRMIGAEKDGDEYVVAEVEA